MVKKASHLSAQDLSLPALHTQDFANDTPKVALA